MTVELPRWALADCLTVCLVAASGIVLEVVFASLDGPPPGLGALAAMVLLAWQWRARVRRPLALVVGDAIDLRLADGRQVPLERGPGCRVLGPTVVLDWRAAGTPGTLWLTPVDVRREDLRRLAVWLAAGRPGIER